MFRGAVSVLGPSLTSEIGVLEIVWIPLEYRIEFVVVRRVDFAFFVHVARYGVSYLSWHSCIVDNTPSLPLVSPQERGGGPLIVCRTFFRIFTGSLVRNCDQKRHFLKFMISSGCSRPGNDMRDGQLSCQLSSLTFGQCGHGLSLSLSMTSSESVPSESLDGGEGGVGGNWSFVSQEETFWDPVVCIEGLGRCRVCGSDRSTRI